MRKNDIVLNEEKTSYIKFKTDRISDEEIRQSESDKIVSAFRKFLPFEEKFGKDSAEFNKEEIEEVYRTSGAAFLAGAMRRHWIMGQYTTWYNKQHGYTDKKNYYLEMGDPTYISDLINDNWQLELTNKDVFISYLEGERSEGELNASDKFSLLALYEGLHGPDLTEIGHLKMSDIQTDGGSHYIISEDGRKKILSDKLYEYAQEANLEGDRFTYGHQRRKVYLLNPASVYIVKPIKKSKKEESGLACRRRISLNCLNALQEIGLATCSLVDIMRFGQVSFIKTKAMEHGMSPFEYGQSEIGMSEFASQYDSPTSARIVNNYPFFFK